MNLQTHERLHHVMSNPQHVCDCLHTCIMLCPIFFVLKEVYWMWVWLTRGVGTDHPHSLTLIRVNVSHIIYLIQQCRWFYDEFILEYYQNRHVTCVPFYHVSNTLSDRYDLACVFVEQFKWNEIKNVALIACAHTIGFDLHPQLVNYLWKQCTIFFSRANQSSSP